MGKTIYDIFISYRRDGGGETAGRIYDSLMRDGYSVSYDVDTLREGRFDKQLLERIEQCQDFVLVVDKNCFMRTIDPTTDPQDDWLWQELSYALQLKKNIIPVLQAGAKFPKKLPEDIDHVRFSNGPTYSHEYFDEFYKKLRDGFLRAYPRMAKVKYGTSVSPANKLANLKLKADLDCTFYLDGEERSQLKAGIIQKIPLAKGEYELLFVSVENEADRLEIEFEMPEVDKLQKVNLSGIRDSRLQKEAEAVRIADEKRKAEEKHITEEQRLYEERKREAEREAEEERKRHKEEERAKEKTFTVGGVPFKMIRVEGGSFMMGSPDNDPDASEDETPQREVKLNDYFIGETQVTQALWVAVMGSNPSQNRGPNLPVECVAWENSDESVSVQTFIRKLNEKLRNLLPDGLAFRLPTEAEWEFAARGGKKSYGYKYAGSNNIGEVAWYGENSGAKTHPVKGKKPNELGLYDMSGNVWEWCLDCYKNDFYKKGYNINPKGPKASSNYVFRGGSCFDHNKSCRIANRSSGFYNHRDFNIGFRLTLVVTNYMSYNLLNLKHILLSMHVNDSNR